MARLLLSIAWIALFPLTVWAQVQGEDDPRYQKLRTEWLAGADDLATLRDMAALANDGNVAAQVTLGLIEYAFPTHYYVTNRLSPDSRKAIFRKPNGRFGVPWIRVAAPNSPLAALLMHYKDTDYAAHSAALADAGVIGLAIAYANMPMNLGDTLSTMRALGHPALLPYTGPALFPFMQAFEAGVRGTKYEDLANGISDLRQSLPALDSGDQILVAPFFSSKGAVSWEESEDAWRARGADLLQHPKLAPMNAVVRAACPQNAEDVMGVLFHLRGSQQARLDLISPLAPLVSTEDWLASARFKGDLLRVWYPTSSKFKDLEQRAPCYAKAVIEAYQP
ncbi:hypothetical protein [Pseudosulfitobacter pseudonitzschiae]|uniref:hypothetical protein n=1 Tax=Pseudosulfitobacter pseudonitzschiae TaxID=1402135 RepID=UPI001AFB1582|nr:hypothetical protein [Pseudosulfitobacter pseudonitzschiae]MBM1813700.1 hypothetical protein [Pseudosulfitobacter pseudonitzschiae]MBM1830693.1 hypothetical protein [Pseudosulfitobacter pseudonitzschiae]MBM1835560.1 hypothetical protein [Pseudosulfitobacter pseudonitzschiae]MBM1840406.1 hypothetical protein [Pseudosulfitobacter pseudonitzschiae]MBM1845606.1 hypothetical protein [Pseudosulfitobacter pseudonitzschiae]